MSKLVRFALAVALGVIVIGGRNWCFRSALKRLTFTAALYSNRRKGKQVTLLLFSPMGESRKMDCVNPQLEVELGFLSYLPREGVPVCVPVDLTSRMSL